MNIYSVIKYYIKKVPIGLFPRKLIMANLNDTTYIVKEKSKQSSIRQFAYYTHLRKNKNIYYNGIGIITFFIPTSCEMPTEQMYYEDVNILFRIYNRNTY